MEFKDRILNTVYLKSETFINYTKIITSFKDDTPWTFSYRKNNRTFGQSKKYMTVQKFYEKYFYEVDKIEYV